MRVSSLRGAERGGVAVIVAVLAVPLFALGAYALDLGNLWQTRRHLVTATDAAALAAAQTYAVGDNGCGGVDDAFVAANFSAATVQACTPSAGAAGGDSSGYVTVDALTTVRFTFAGVLGHDDSDVRSATTAMYGIPSAYTGLRPLGLCLDASPELAAWLNLPDGPDGSSGTVRITYSKEHPDACGSDVPGNWGVLDFDGGANSNADTRAWLRDGYPGEVSVGQIVDGDTGAFSTSLNSALQYLLDTGLVFGLPVFDTATGNGSNARFHVAAVVAVKIVGFRTTGSQADRYIDLQFQQAVLQGSCCTQGPDTGVRAVRICAVDPTFDVNDCLPEG
ncbi:MAG: pilus assembly protein TadG-related protein [Acidimicrobiia bacterium]|nr:pilus assembly protein TadG-related protein [Acidimicrobiia bacterium]